MVIVGKNNKKGLLSSGSPRRTVVPMEERSKKGRRAAMTSSAPVNESLSKGQNSAQPKKITDRHIAPSPSVSSAAPFSVPLFKELDAKAFQSLGLPNTVYIRKIEREALPEPLVRLLPTNGGASFYSVHTADGTPLALVSNRTLAFAEARDHKLRPVSVH